MHRVLLFLMGRWYSEPVALERVHRDAAKRDEAIRVRTELKSYLRARR